MNENEIVTLALDVCFKIHRQYGPGLFESVYEENFLSRMGKKLECLLKDNMVFH